MTLTGNKYFYAQQNHPPTFFYHTLPSISEGVEVIHYTRQLQSPDSITVYELF